jgi:hypothetical protein
VWAADALPPRRPRSSRVTPNSAGFGVYFCHSAAAPAAHTGRNNSDDNTDRFRKPTFHRRAP